MRWFGVLLIIFVTTVTGRAEDWTTADGKTYRNVVIVAQEDDGVRVTYDGGVGKLPYYELPDNIILRLGQDPAALAIKRKAMLQAQADAAFQAKQDAAAAAELKKQQEDAAAIAAALKANQAPAPAPVVPKAQPENPPAAPLPPPPSPVAPAPPPPPPVVVVPPPAAVVSAPKLPVEPLGAYPSSKFRYDDSTDFSYLESPVIQVESMSPDASPTDATAPGQNATLFLRVATEGERVEAPDQVEGIFVSSTALKNLSTGRSVKFLVDGAFIVTRPPIESTDPDAAPNPQTSNRSTFFLSPEQLRTVLGGTNVNFSIGSYDYRIDEKGINAFRAYLSDVDRLPPASPNFFRAYHRFMNQLPSIVTIISTTCEYIILGAFGVIVVAALAAFIMGMTRFFKM